MTHAFDPSTGNLADPTVTDEPDMDMTEDAEPASEHTTETDVTLLLCAVQDTSGLTDEQARRVAAVKDEQMLARRQEEENDER